MSDGNFQLIYPPDASEVSYEEYLDEYHAPPMPASMARIMASKRNPVVMTTSLRSVMGLITQAAGEGKRGIYVSPRLNTQEEAALMSLGYHLNTLRHSVGTQIFW